MGRQRHGAEQIIANLREVEVELARGKTAGEVCRKLGQKFLATESGWTLQVDRLPQFEPARRVRWHEP